MKGRHADSIAQAIRTRRYGSLAAAARGSGRIARRGHDWGGGVVFESAQPPETRPVAALRRPERQ